MKGVDKTSEKYKRWLEQMRDVNRRYRQQHKEALKEYQKKYYDERKDDEEFRKKRCERSKRHYHKKVAEKTKRFAEDAQEERIEKNDEQF